MFRITILQYASGRVGRAEQVVYFHRSETASHQSLTRHSYAVNFFTVNLERYMPNRLIRPAADDTTRERILKAAILRFSTHSYEETGLRDIAADVGVDMAYVHRSFGSKEKLFREAVKTMIRPEVWLVGEASELHMTLAEDVLAEKGANEIRPFDILARSFSSPEASRVFRELIDDGFVRPFASKCPVVSEQRAAMVAAFLAGVASFVTLSARQLSRTAEMIVN